MITMKWWEYRDLWNCSMARNNRSDMWEQIAQLELAQSTCILIIFLISTRSGYSWSTCFALWRTWWLLFASSWHSQRETKLGILTKGNKKFSFLEYISITQLCGRNIVQKPFKDFFLFLFCRTFYFLDSLCHKTKKNNEYYCQTIVRQVLTFLSCNYCF